MLIFMFYILHKSICLYDSVFFLYCLVVVLLAPWVCISISLYLYNDNKDHSIIH